MRVSRDIDYIAIKLKIRNNIPLTEQDKEVVCVYLDKLDQSKNDSIMMEARRETKRLDAMTKGRKLKKLPKKKATR